MYEEQVKERHPDAFAQWNEDQQIYIIRSDPFNMMWLGDGPTEDEAWEDAAGTL